ncbi:MAG: FAD-binding oxidoreductase [Planctomycetota bacterium]
MHSRLNATRVAEVLCPASVDELIDRVRAFHLAGRSVCVSGGRHAMGGQQFAAGEVLVDVRGLDRLVAFDAEVGHATFEAGAQWPGVIRQLHDAQGSGIRWGIRQKQTGADDLTLAGAVSANVHGRGLMMGPIVDDIEALEVLDVDGEVMRCSRDENAERFALVIGGYGLFGVILTVTLRLGPRRALRRRVDVLDIDEAIPAVRRRAADGCVYGDFQYAIAPDDADFLRRGVCACYAPSDTAPPEDDPSRKLTREDWARLMSLAARDKRAAFDAYAMHYLSTHGRCYWSDEMQLSAYLPSYDAFLQGATGGVTDETLMIGEQYVPPDDLLDFLEEARGVLRRTGVADFYGTIRTILPDTISFLPWAKSHYACVIFNLQTRHDAAGVARSSDAFRGLNDAALRRGGSFFLTYHRWSTREQIELAYPRFEAFLERKSAIDPDARLTSDWYRHHLALFG